MNRVHSPTDVEGSRSPVLSHISPIVASVHCVLALTYVALLARGEDDTRIFSVMSNVCYVVAGLAMNFTIRFGRAAGDAGVDGSIHEVGLLVLGLVGATSFSFHTSHGISPKRVPDGFSDRRHVFDILAIFLLLVHLFHVHLSVCLGSFASSTTTRAVIRAAVSAVFIANVGIVIFLYDEILGSQPLLLYVAAPPIALLAVLGRLRLASSQYERLWSVPFNVAVFEIVTILVALLSAGYAQCELLGETYLYYRPSWSFSTEGVVAPQSYDFYHGNWHYLTSLIISLIYVRCADASAALDAHKPNGRHQHRVRWDDVFAQGLILLYALVLLASKELRWDLDATRKLLAGLVLLFMSHAGFYARRLLRHFAKQGRGRHGRDGNRAMLYCCTGIRHPASQPIPARRADMDGSDV